MPRHHANTGRHKRVENSAETTGKLPGGITGKGFRTGQSGNPGGRPKKHPISERYAARAEAPLPERLRKKMGLTAGATWADAGVLAQFEAMASGNSACAKEIRESIEGKATNRVEITTSEHNEASANFRAKLMAKLGVDLF